MDVQIWPIPGDVQDWFTDPDFDLGRWGCGSRDDAVRGHGRRRHEHPDLPRCTAPPPALPERRCQVTGAAGTFFRPTWSPDGSTLAWQEDDGIHTIRIDLETCQGSSSLVIPGGKHPDWGPRGRRPRAHRHGARAHPPWRAAHRAQGEGEVLVHRHGDAAPRQEGDRQDEESGLGVGDAQGEAEPRGPGSVAQGRQERVGEGGRSRPHGDQEGEDRQMRSGSCRSAAAPQFAGMPIRGVRLRA